MKIVTVVGARPQFIKAAVVSRAIEQHNLNRLTKIQEIIIHTGQHYDKNMSAVFFEQMQIPNPRYNLGIGGTSQGAMTGQMIEQIEALLVAEKPDIVLVYGDTNSTLAGALAAVKLHIPIAHVEGGVRSFNMQTPEEINRILTDRISHWVFCPSNQAVENLIREGLSQDQGVNVHNVGDVMCDAASFYQKIAHPSSLVESLINKLDSKFYLATVHREENTDYPDRLTTIMKALDCIGKHTPVILPLHPRTKKILGDRAFANIQILEPQSYFDMIQLLTNCQGVLTDSGGLQKEAYFFAKPCITLLEETEWGELVDCGLNYLAGADFNEIVDCADRIHSQSFNFDTNKNLYGSGNAGGLIIKLLMDIL